MHIGGPLANIQWWVEELDDENTGENKQRSKQTDTDLTKQAI